ncbi:MAG: hypothetical protein QGH38_04075 [Candidatus Thalassarchaeaceae archaeon]|nr:hypothetical protein [Candidatus Thalassarchaeaceae archaeon]
MREEKAEFNPNDERERFAEYSIEQCIQAFNRDAGSGGWVPARGRFHGALREKFLGSKYDCSDFITIGPGKYGVKSIVGSMKVMKKIRIEGDKIVQYD